jgi:topoisomerase IA-like protein
MAIKVNRALKRKDNAFTIVLQEGINIINKKIKNGLKNNEQKRSDSGQCRLWPCG